jgi:hypothetical protein
MASEESLIGWDGTERAGARGFDAGDEADHRRNTGKLRYLPLESDRQRNRTGRRRHVDEAG